MIRELLARIRKESGQSLVETALFLPVLILLVAGVVEVSHIAITANRVTTAARNGARFGAQGGEDIGIRNVALNTVTQTLQLAPDGWDMWVVRANTDDSGNITEDNFSATHVYGTGSTQVYSATETSAYWADIRTEIETELGLDEYSNPANAAGLTVVGLLIVHDIQSILGLDIIPALTGMNTVRGFAVMRNSALATTVTQSTGCTGVFPLIVDNGVRSIDEDFYNTLGLSRNYNEYPNHQEDVELLQGREGYLYWLQTGTSSQNVGLLQWDPAASPPLLNDSLEWPGNSQNYHEPGDPDFDQTLHVGDRVQHSTESLAAASSALNDHVSTGRTLRLPLWNGEPGGGGYVGTGGDDHFFVDGFAVFRIRAYSSTWILFELFRIDESCGQS